MNTPDVKAQNANVEGTPLGNEACGIKPQECPSPEETQISDTYTSTNAEADKEKTDLSATSSSTSATSTDSEKTDMVNEELKESGFAPKENVTSEAQAKAPEVDIPKGNFKPIDVDTKAPKTQVPEVDPRNAAAEKIKNAMKAENALKQKKGGHFKVEWKKVTQGGVAGVVLSSAAIMVATPASAIINDTNPINYDDLILDGGDEGISPFAAMVNPDVSWASGVNNEMSFSQAFASARAEVGPGGVFEWRGQLYGTFTAEEWDGMSEEERLDFNNHFSMPSDDFVPDGSEDSETIDHNTHSRSHFAHSEQEDTSTEAEPEAELAEVAGETVETAETIGYEMNNETFFAENSSNVGGEGVQPQPQEQMIVEAFDEGDNNNTYDLAQTPVEPIDATPESPEVEVIIENNDEASTNLFASDLLDSDTATKETLNLDPSINDLAENELAEAEVEVLGVYQDEATGMTIGGMNINGQEVLLIDVENDGEFDIAAIDFNSNGQVDIGEIVDINELNFDDPLLSQTDDVADGMVADDILDSGLNNDDSFLV